MGFPPAQVVGHPSCTNRPSYVSQVETVGLPPIVLVYAAMSKFPIAHAGVAQQFGAIHKRWVEGHNEGTPLVLSGESLCIPMPAKD